MKLYMFRTVPLSIIRSFPLYTQQSHMSYRIADSLRAGSGWNILILLASCPQNCMTYTIAVCTVKNSRWWTKQLSEICRVSFQNKFAKLVHLVSFIYLFFFLWRCDPTRVMASSFTRFLDHAQRCTTVGRTPLDEWSALAETSTWQHTTLKTDKYSCPRRDSNPRSQQASGRRPTP